MAHKRTRQEASTKLSDYLGKGKEFNPTELPTLRDCLRYGILLKETNPELQSNKVMMTKVLKNINQNWLKANFKFKPPVTNEDRNILAKLTALWDKAVKIARKQLTSAKDIEKLEEKLDKLFDITKCRCPIVDCCDEGVVCTGCHCEEADCAGCPKNLKDIPPCHVICVCPASQRIPILDLPFIRAQRAKIGEKSEVMIASVDKKESHKQNTEAHKKKEKEDKKQAAESTKAEKKKMEEEEKRAGEQRVAEFLGESTPEVTEEMEKVNNNDTDWNANCKQKQKKNFTSIKNVALASIRFGLSANATAAVANATLLDYGVISQDNTKDVVDAMKVQRAKESAYKELQERAAFKYKEDRIECILYDGRKDWTLMYQEIEGSSKLYPSIQKEEHYSVVSEPGGHYLTHFTTDDDDINHTAAEKIAIALVEWMKEYGVDKTLIFIGGDSTNVNSGIWGGAIQFVEKLLGRPLIWIMCGLHLVELPLRHLICDLDGPTCSATGHTGPLGKALDTATELPINKSFKKISIGEDLIRLDDEILKDLSTDQKYGYEIVQAIRSGILPERLANLEIGPVNHSRWNTKANRFCRMWVSLHGFKGQEARHLKMIVEYIVGVYYPVWFKYKVRNHWVEGAKICLEQLQLTLLQSKQVVNIVFPHMESSAWWAHPEMLLQTLLCSSNPEDRKYAVKSIIQVRKRSDKDSEQIRTHHKVKLNKKATLLKDLIIWEDEITCEPILTQNMTEAELKSLEASPMAVPVAPVHAQNVERCVKEVTAASEAVYGYERRDGFIRARLEHRNLTGGLLRSKKDHAKIVGPGNS